MIRWMSAGVVGLLLVSGCDSRQPTVRQGGVAREEVSERPEANTASSPHGSGTMSGVHGQGATVVDIREVQVGRMQLVAPEDWTRKLPRSSLVIAEFYLPRAEGDGEDARLTITAVGGSVDENIARWRGQFGGNVENESVEKIEVAGVKVVLVDLSGAYSGQHGGVGIAERQPSYRMLAAVIDLPTHQHVVKCYGPGNTITKHADAFETFVQSLSPPGGGTTGKLEVKTQAPVEAKPAAAGSSEEKVSEEKVSEEKVSEEKVSEEKVSEGMASETDSQ